jgi:hypothetical protein
MKKQKTIPTVFAIVLLVIGIVAGVFLIQTDKVFETSASPELSPKQVKITNITDKSFTVSWVTDQPSQGFISYGDSKSLGIVATQQSSLPKASTTVHHTTITSIKPNTTYYFKVGANDQLFDNNGQLYQVKTGLQLQSAPQPDIIFGNVVDTTGKALADAIVYITIAGVTPQSALTDSSGKWSLPLSTARNNNLSSFAVYNSDSLIEISVQSPGKVATAKVKVKDAHPVPTITIGQNHDFTSVNSLPAGSLPKAQITLPQDTSQAIQQTAPTSQVSVTLVTPFENEVVTTNKLTVRGAGTAKTSLTLKIQSSKTVTGTTTIDSQGNWSWTVPGLLSDGSYTISISWKDENSQTKNLSRPFTISTQNAALSSPAVGSPAVNNPVITPSPSPVPTIKPKEVISTSTTPVSGSLTPSIAIFIMGFAMLIGGFLVPKLRA